MSKLSTESRYKAHTFKKQQRKEKPLLITVKLIQKGEVSNHVKKIQTCDVADADSSSARANTAINAFICSKNA